MSGALYDADVFAWSAEQAELLRRLARGERVNGLDWENLIEEIESVGISERNAVASLLEQALVHLLKIVGWPDSDAVEHWRGEVLNFLLQARRRYTPAMRRTLDVEEIFTSASRLVARLRMKGTGPATLPAACPFTLDALLADDPDPDALVARLTAAAPPPDRPA